MKEKEFNREMVALIKALKKEIRDDYRADDESTTPSMSVTVGADANGWGYQTGDNCYTGGAYGFPHWAVVSIDRRSNSQLVANDICDQLGENEYAAVFDADRRIS